mgnify:FL=1
MFAENAETVFIHYGFGNEWNDLNEVEMEKTELGYQAEITLTSFDTFNFCFRDGNNVWDNNEGQNYIFPIEKNIVSLVVAENTESSLLPTRRLRKSYIWNKKIRLAVYKIITYLPKIISGNYKRRVTE